MSSEFDRCYLLQAKNKRNNVVCQLVNMPASFYEVVMNLHVLRLFTSTSCLINKLSACGYKVFIGFLPGFLRLLKEIFLLNFRASKRRV